MKKTLWKKVVFSFIAVFAVLVVIEAGLQFYRWMLVRKNIGEPSVETGQKIILSLGESTTYGLGVPKKNYSALLDRYLDRASEPVAYRVVNLGYGGAVSDAILECFKEALKVYDPVCVLVNMGANDFWYPRNFKVRGISKTPKFARHPFALEKNRLAPKMFQDVLIIRILKYALWERRENIDDGPWLYRTDREGNKRFIYDHGAKVGGAWTEQQRDRIRENLKKNILEIRDICKSKNIQLVFVGYIHGYLNNELFSWCCENSIAFVNNFIPDEKQRKRFLQEDMFHPNELGHEFIMNNIILHVLPVMGIKDFTRIIMETESIQQILGRAKEPPSQPADKEAPGP